MGLDRSTSREVYFGVFATVGISLNESRYAAVSAPLRIWISALTAQGGTEAAIASKARLALEQIESCPSQGGFREQKAEELLYEAIEEDGSISDALAGVMGKRFANLGWAQSMDSDTRGVMMEGPVGTIALLNLAPPFPVGDGDEDPMAKAASDLDKVALGLGLPFWSSVSGAYMQGGGVVIENDEIDWTLARGWEALKERDELDRALGESRLGESESSRGKGAL